MGVSMKCWVPSTHRGPIEPCRFIQLLLNLLILDELVEWLEEVKIDIHDVRREMRDFLVVEWLVFD